MIEAVITRLKAEVPFLQQRVDGAAQFTELVASGKLAPVTPAAHVIPVGLRGGNPDVASGLFRQLFTQTVAVALTLRGQDPNGRRALQGLDAHLMEIITALAGWAPDDEVGVFRFVSGRVALISRGDFVYELTFSIEDQLRIPT
ncbi:MULTISPECIES: hypothetical protein [unclassified Yoonia]|uniref:phage tail terminator protein n=1 Tax=unclassified Yoonia TaxID=2629118 RepID=UPI002AFE918E|nr:MULTISPECIES: hypothetical protein [unclassified Yoonia]